MSDEDRKDNQPAPPPNGEEPSPNLDGVLKAITGSDREKGIHLSGDDQEK